MPDIITLDSTVREFNINPYLEILEDPDSRLDEAVILADRLRTVIEKSPAKYQGKEIYYTISAGVAESKRSITSLDQLIKKADDALYEAKNKGRNRIVG